LPVLNLVVVFVVGDLPNRRGEPDGAGGLFHLAAEMAGQRVELGRVFSSCMY
jgi:hypothetical protein